MTRIPEPSPQTYARICGILYLFIIVAALFAEVSVRGEIIVRGDAAATASNLLRSKTVFRVSVAGEALTWLCDVTVGWILYVLLKPVNRNLALLAAFHRVAFVAVYAVSKLVLIAAVELLKGEDFLKAFDPQQLQSLSYLSFRMHGLGYGLSLIFFGFHCAVFGYLIYKSDYLPRILGTLWVIAGAGYLISSFAQIVAPPTSRLLFPWIVLPALPAELGLALWLLVKGVDLPKWQEAAGRNDTSYD